MFKDFKAFLNQGNVMGLAVGVIIGGAFGTIVKSLTVDVLMPLIGFITGVYSLGCGGPCFPPHL